MRAWASELAHLSMAGANIVSVGPVVCLSLSCLFPEILSGFWWAVAVVSRGFSFGAWGLPPGEHNTKAA